MLTKLEVRNAEDSLLELTLDDTSDGFVLADIQGLDPVKATLVSSGFANMDGELYHSSRREKRNLLIKIELEPDFVLDSVRDLRKRLYSFFMPKTEVQLRFYMTDGPTVNIMGRIESFDAPLFAQNPEANISLLCFDSDFVDLTDVEVSGNTVSTGTETLVAYEGTVESGIQFTLNVNRALTGFFIYHRLPDDTVRSLEIEGASLQGGDVVDIVTIPGSKIVTLTRSGITSSLLYALAPESTWIELQPGTENYIRIYAVGAAIPYELHYLNRYGGL